MSFTEVVKAFDSVAAQSLAKLGFRRIANGIWNRREADELNVLELQRHSIEAAFCVNLGVHYSFLPKAGSEERINDLDGVDITACELKFRLTSLDDDKDQWWPTDSANVTEVLELFLHRGLPTFDLYRLDGPIAGMDPKDVLAGEMGVLHPLTKVRACLLLARLHEHMGHREKSVDAASTGLRVAGMAIGPKKALRDILHRLAG